MAGDIYHVDSIVSERQVVFAAMHKYGHPPMDVAHEGGTLTTRTLPADAPEKKALDALNRGVIATLGLVRGVTHTEFIQARDGSDFYFLETSGAGRRCVHRGRDRGGDRDQSLAGVGENRDRRRRRHLPTA